MTGRGGPLRHVLLSLADDELVLGHRDSEWTAFAPFIEEDVALASICL
ncbi:MAG: phenylacetate-CoA oxygenase subunit PaaI, partial [Bryobacteraceae bacterium]|nr:phenylacetate-CoA oxygenase subunit PaaI [Bryobacteraceae bacterium]